MYIRSSKNTTRAKGRRVYAAEEEPQAQGNGAVSVDPEATELVFETEDVAELIAEVTNNDVEVVADENQVTFTVGDTDYTVEAEGGEEVLEAATSMRGRKTVRANRNVNRRNVAASRNIPASSNGRVVRRINRK